MFRPLALISIAALLALAGCGGGDSTSSDSGGDSASESASYDIKVSEFIVDDEATKTQILKDYVADNPDCNADVDHGYLLEVSAAATNVSPDSDLPKLIANTC